MKWLLSFFMLMSLGFTPSAWSYIPRLPMILDRTVDNSGKGIYQIEQEVTFSVGLGEPLVLKETWTVENEDSYRLTVTGTRELKDTLSWSFLFSHGQRIQATPQGKLNKKVGEDFAERWFHFRKPEALAQALINLQVLSPSTLRQKPTRHGTDFTYHQQNGVRLSRTGGVVTWALGVPSSAESAPSPGVWIEQDQFVIRKIRTTSQAEITAENFGNYARGLVFPRKRTIHWDNNQVQIQVVSVSSPSQKPIAAQLEMGSKADLPDSLPEKNLIEEFYKRFR